MVSALSFGAGVLYAISIMFSIAAFIAVFFPLVTPPHKIGVDVALSAAFPALISTLFIIGGVVVSTYVPKITQINTTL